MIYYAFQFYDYDVHAFTAPPAAPAIQEVEITIVGSEPTYFYTVYNANGSYRTTVCGRRAMVEEYYELSKRDGHKVSAIIPNLPLSENLKFHYSWQGGEQKMTLRKEYQPARAKAA